MVAADVFVGSAANATATFQAIFTDSSLNSVYSAGLLRVAKPPLVSAPDRPRSIARVNLGLAFVGLGLLVCHCHVLCYRRRYTIYFFGNLPFSRGGKPHFRSESWQVKVVERALAALDPMHQASADRRALV